MDYCEAFGGGGSEKFWDVWKPFFGVLRISWGKAQNLEKRGENLAGVRDVHLDIWKKFPRKIKILCNAKISVVLNRLFREKPCDLLRRRKKISSSFRVNNCSNEKPTRITLKQQCITHEPMDAMKPQKEGF